MGLRSVLMHQANTDDMYTQNLPKPGVFDLFQTVKPEKSTCHINVFTYFVVMLTLQRH